MTERRLSDAGVGFLHFVMLIAAMVLFAILSSMVLGLVSDAGMTQTNMLGQLAGQQILVLIGITVLFVRTSRFQWSEVVGVPRRLLGWGVFITLFTPGFIILEDHLLDWWNEFGGFVEPDWYQDALVVTGVGSSVVVLGVVAVLAALSEEFVFRGYFMRRFASLGAPRAIVLQAILFTVFHFEPHGVPVYLLSGLALGVLRHLSGSIAIGIVFHALNNTLSVWDFNTGPTVLSEPTLWATVMAVVLVGASVVVARSVLGADRSSQATPDTKV